MFYNICAIAKVISGGASVWRVLIHSRTTPEVHYRYQPARGGPGCLSVVAAVDPQPQVYRRSQMYPYLYVNFALTPSIT